MHQGRSLRNGLRSSEGGCSQILGVLENLTNPFCIYDARRAVIGGFQSIAGFIEQRGGGISLSTFFAGLVILDTGVVLATDVS